MSYVLLIDDSVDDLAAMRKVIAAHESLAAECAGNYEEALKSVEHRLPDLVVIDPNLPDGQSLHFIRTLRKEHPTIPTIIVSSIGEEQAAIDALQAGAASYVPKHLIGQVLIPTIREVLVLADQQRCHSRMLQLMTRWDCDFVLENDRSLIAPVVAYLQQHAVQLGVCDDSDSTRLGIALDEALANALYHGNLELDSELREEDTSAYEKLAIERAQQAPYSGRKLRVQTRMTQGEAEFIVEDEGPGFDPSSLPDPREPANLDRVSGRGVLLMRTFMDEVEYSESGNRVTMRKRASG